MSEPGSASAIIKLILAIADSRIEIRKEEKEMNTMGYEAILKAA